MATTAGKLEVFVLLLIWGPGRSDLSSPASLLFTPTGRPAEAACTFDYNLPCSGWQMWKINGEIRSGYYFPLQFAHPLWPTATGDVHFQLERIPDASGATDQVDSLVVTNHASVYIMSPELEFSSRRKKRGVCMTFFYRLVSTSEGRLEVFVLTKKKNDPDDGSYYFNATEHLASNVQAEWPSTWYWMVNNVQKELPRNTVKARVVIFLRAGRGVVSLDDLEIFNTTCNLRPAPDSHDSNRPNDTAVNARVWPSIHIAYEIRQGFSPIQLSFLQKILDDLFYHTCVSFVKRRNNQPDYVEFVHTAEGCTSQRIGYYGGKQRVHLADSCFDKGTMSHEILHVIGLFHEHQRPDRDEHIEILRDNVDPAYIEQFTKYNEMDRRMLSVPYDYRSVMHYRDNAFAVDRGLKTMRPLNNLNVVTLGNYHGPTYSDYLKVANLYCYGALRTINEAPMKTSPPFQPTLWEKGEIPVEFDANFNTGQTAALLNAIEDLNLKTCLRFRPRTNQDKDFVLFKLTNSECFARSGKIGGRQVVSLFSGNCFSPRLVFWLLLHIAGLDAEHRRPDRDVYVKINVPNIPQSHRESFQKFDSIDWRVLSVPYDINSVLHYGNKAFAVNPRENTITAKRNASWLLGNQIGPSPMDYAKIIRLYNCSAQYWKGFPGSMSRPDADNAARSPPLALQGDHMQSVPLVLQLWDGGLIPYVVNEEQFTIAEGRQILRVILSFNSHSCVKFIPRTNETDFIEFVKNAGNAAHNSYWCRTEHRGRIGGRQLISLQPRCLSSTSHIYLALFFTVGLPEEHRRPDRDEYVEIMWNNILESAKTYFYKYTDIDERLLSVEYDISSITHYTSTAFTKKAGVKTIVAKENANLKLGSIEPTRADYLKITNLYC